jgi:hypothetical protein
VWTDDLFAKRRRAAYGDTVGPGGSPHGLAALLEGTNLKVFPPSLLRNAKRELEQRQSTSCENGLDKAS